MLDGCNDLNNELKSVLIKALEEARRMGSSRIGTDHLLMALAQSNGGLTSQALSSMKIEVKVLENEIRKLVSDKDFSACESGDNTLPGNSYLLHVCAGDSNEQQIHFSDRVIESFTRADNLSHYLGDDEIAPCHLLLAIVDQKHSCADRVFDELSINMNFLRGKILHLMASSYLKYRQNVNLRKALVFGLNRLIEKHTSALCVVQELIQKSGQKIIDLPDKGQILRAVCTAYLADCLFTQTAFQRYLLEAALCSLSDTAGALSDEVASQIVYTTAQHLREEVRGGIEYVWTDEYRLIHHMLDDAEHDLIGSIIEDLWWAYSEDIALDKSFSAALADHRKSHQMDLQSRRVELTRRLSKLKQRLEETVKLCFQGQQERR